MPTTIHITVNFENDLNETEQECFAEQLSDFVIGPNANGLSLRYVEGSDSARISPITNIEFVAARNFWGASAARAKKPKEK